MCEPKAKHDNDEVLSGRENAVGGITKPSLKSAREGLWFSNSSRLGRVSLGSVARSPSLAAGSIALSSPDAVIVGAPGGSRDRSLHEFIFIRHFTDA